LRYRLDDGTPHNRLHGTTDIVREVGPPDPHARRTGHAPDADIPTHATAAAFVVKHNRTTETNDRSRRCPGAGADASRAVVAERIYLKITALARLV
jgi:hypothetical protein